MNNPGNKQIVMRFYEAFNDRNLDKLDRVLQSGWMIHPQLPGQGSALQKYKPIAAAFLAAFPDLQFKIEGTIAEDDTVAVRATIVGTQRGKWLGVAPTGQRIQIVAHDFHRIEAGQIAESWHLEDWLLGMQQMKATI
ncbi:ester cyclase [Chamaesiphon minutus]|uniref:Putative ester cyclase n=1 Tax=Chamaesiphon minutus (strain ATCC 27169 / PCC 6605) TaxID=1173020 RepID=K9UMZ9_CHAP6|nr:ester cyclase [Chamaesiphon minutus]AFY96482.1 putative ester cyclase [Chamaesiphon minutus PCC 6605]